MDVYRGWYRDLEVKRKKLVRSKSKGVLHNMQKTVLSDGLSRNMNNEYRIQIYLFDL